MKIKEICDLLDGEILCNAENADKEVASAFASDMMSDVLAFVKDQGVLITGLANPQVVRTALMMDISCIVMVRGKVLDQNIVGLAKDNGIVIISTNNNMFETSGILYPAGMNS